MRYELPSGSGSSAQLIRFDGDLLGEASSEEFAKSEGRRNWHEVRVYRTTDGSYVVEKVGGTSVPGQSTRSTVHHSTTARGAIECLQTTDSDGVVYMTHVARSAIRQACEADAHLADAFRVRDLTA